MVGTPSLFRTALDALLLRESAYDSMRYSDNPAWRGFLLVAVIGLVVAVAGIVGAAWFEWTAPDFDAIQETVWDGMVSGPWFDELAPSEKQEAIDAMEFGYELGWRIANIFIPSIRNALAGLLLTPIWMIMFWLAYGLLAHVTARILGGTGSLGVTYGATALAAAPQLLTVAKVVPTVQMFGVGAWALACAFVALRSAHGLNTNRTFWSTVVPYVVIALLIAMFAGLGALVFSLTAGSIVDGGLGS